MITLAALAFALASGWLIRALCRIVAGSRPAQPRHYEVLAGTAANPFN